MTNGAWILPDWPAPPSVKALSTTRAGGASKGRWRSMNLGLHCGDDRADVMANRQRLRQALPAEPLWMRQEHGNRVLDDDSQAGEKTEADARVSSKVGAVLAVLTADCLPLLLCDDAGGRVGIAHAGWRGMARGVIEAAVERMDTKPGRMLAWLGPAIGGAVYEVGDEVREAFDGGNAASRACRDQAFLRCRDRWLFDLAGAARIILTALGVERVYGGRWCTCSDPERFYSHRRDGVTGRMASLIWLAPR